MMRRAPRADIIILLITFAFTVLTDLVVAVNIGIVLAILQFLRRMAGSFRIVPVPLRNLGVGSSVASPTGTGSAAARVLRVEGPLFFAAVEPLRTALAGIRAGTLVLCLEHVPFADATALQVLDDEIAVLRAAGVRVLLSGANDRIQRKLTRMGTLARLQDGDCTPNLAQALQRLGVTTAA